MEPVRSLQFLFYIHCFFYPIKRYHASLTAVLPNGLGERWWYRSTLRGCCWRDTNSCVPYPGVVRVTTTPDSSFLCGEENKEKRKCEDETRNIYKQYISAMYFVPAVLQLETLLVWRFPFGFRTVDITCHVSAEPLLGPMLASPDVVSMCFGIPHPVLAPQHRKAPRFFFFFANDLHTPRIAGRLLEIFSKAQPHTYS